jgi:hypothetical protein
MLKQGGIIWLNKIYKNPFGNTSAGEYVYKLLIINY